ncbi:hypothetical protein ASPFODRAFT_53142 [Aspergillus luchuensis CBS 106.47]|uniref:Uncharacterized protein n=1 Tax=Aspergillus luchuensis (strain CBS 106.47) TaxID=1137211 RepID=A0A1M3T0Y8_ASPLC|nr:hypothetical protein ASPFODRAFT_55150 [Aspergillus luchuensis CBS 106.47]OJZ80391.1 hypothetical protein ASPFODRAFT_53142 [Aspergillus luchuensis CBS 106.47]
MSRCVANCRRWLSRGQSYHRLAIGLVYYPLLFSPLHQPELTLPCGKRCFERDDG